MNKGMMPEAMTEEKSMTPESRKILTVSRKAESIAARTGMPTGQTAPGDRPEGRIMPAVKGSGLIRCNRKYIVNLSKVSMLRKENEGYILDLCNEDIPPLPVTKTYVDSVLGYFAEQQPLMDPIE